MQATDIPGKFLIPWAKDALPGNITFPIPENSTGIPGEACLDLGFPAETMKPIAVGGVAPFGQDFNGVYKMITQWILWQEAGAPAFYDSVFSAAIGGYPKNAILADETQPGTFYANTVDNNTTDPTAAGAGWVPFTPINLQAADTSGTANAMIAALAPVPSGLAFLTNRALIIKKNNSANTGAVTINVNGFGAKSIVNTDGSALQAGQIPANAYITLIYTGAAFQLVAGGVTIIPSINIRTRQTGNVTFYVSTTGNDSNNGLSIGSPFLTRQHAWNVIFNSYDLAGFDVNVLLLDGTYTDGFTGQGPVLGANNPPAIEFQSQSGNAAACIINPASGPCFGAGFNAMYSVSNMTVRSSIGNCFDVANTAQVQLSGMIFGPCTSAHMFAWKGGVILLGGNYTISGSTNYHWDASDHGRILTIPGGSITITLTGTPNFANAFANATDLGLLDIDPGITYSGPGTGMRYNVKLNGVVDTNSGPTLPGSIAGTTATGGQFA